MGKKDQKNNQEELLKTLGDFTSKDNWDSFFTIRGSDDAFEWYAEWPQLQEPLLPHLSGEAQILVPGCGNSKLSEHLYDAGYRNITNIDFSKVVISDMLRRNVRNRPEMKWRVMDITDMQFTSESFDVILDKGGLDALMEPKLGPKLGNQYLAEVKRVLKAGGKFFCLTLAEAHVLGVLFVKFRYGWKMSVHAIAQKQSDKSSLQTFMVMVEKDDSSMLSQIFSSFDQSSIHSPGNQADGLRQALEVENRLREEYSNSLDIVYSLEELKLGAKGNLTERRPGQRLQLTLGEPGISSFSYKAALLDAREEFGPFSYHCGVFLVPKTRAHEWLFSTEEGQWIIVENSKAARLIMILLDSSHLNASMDDIQSDLSPLVKQLAPSECQDASQIPFMAASDGIKKRKIVHEITSSLTGPITVDDVIYEQTDENISCLFQSDNVMFRRLTFQRTESLVQSEAVLTSEGSQKNITDKDQKKNLRSKSRKKGSKTSSDGSRNDLKVDHSYLASPYHTGIISGLMLISSYLSSAASKGGMVKTVVIGLGAGSLPMFLHRHTPFLEIEVVELDPVVLDLARDYFDFREDGNLKVLITDGLKFVKEAAHLVTCSREADLSKLKDSTVSDAESSSTPHIDILIVDVDSSDSSSGLSCPAVDFVKESFLTAVKDSLSDQGLFIINLVSRSPAIKDTVFSRMKSMFHHLFHLELEEDVNEVVFALKTESCIPENRFPEAVDQLSKLLNLEQSRFGKPIIDAAKKIKRIV
nr:methyltransferase-like protein 13 [Ipomoea trifida]